MCAANCEPPEQGKALLISGVTVVGVATAAACTSIFSENRDIGITAWIAVAVVGASTMIATARHSHPNHSHPNYSDPMHSEPKQLNNAETEYPVLTESRF